MWVSLAASISPGTSTRPRGNTYPMITRSSPGGCARAGTIERRTAAQATAHATFELMTLITCVVDITGVIPPPGLTGTACRAGRRRQVVPGRFHAQRPLGTI